MSVDAKITAFKQSELAGVLPPDVVQYCVTPRVFFVPPPPYESEVVSAVIRASVIPHCVVCHRKVFTHQCLCVGCDSYFSLCMQCRKGSVNFVGRCYLCAAAPQCDKCQAAHIVKDINCIGCNTTISVCGECAESLVTTSAVATSSSGYTRMLDFTYCGGDSPHCKPE